MNIIDDIYKFFNCLTLVDLAFLVAVVMLIILLVTLVYFIKINKEVLDDNNNFPPSSNNNIKKIDDSSKDNDLMKIVDEVSKNYAKEEVEYGDEYNDEEGELLDLEGLTKKLQQEESERVSCTEYEKDQEEKAIISYQELLQKCNKYSVNYEKEEIVDDLIIKKVNLNDLVNKNEEDLVQSEVRVISYQKEEAFLNALKELNSLLN